MKRIVIEYSPFESNKTRFCAAGLDSYGGDRVYLDTPYGRHAFSREDGRWLEGDCLNFLDGRIYQPEDLEIAIRSGSAFDVYEGTRHSEPCSAPCVTA